MVETTLSNTQLTKIITIFPMFVVLNKMEHNLLFREALPTCDEPSNSNAAAECTADTGDVNGNIDSDDENGLIPMSRVQTNVWNLITPGQVHTYECYLI